jgi:hypothetical protein
MRLSLARRLRMFILITETLFAADSYEMPLPEEKIINAESRKPTT